MAFTSPSGARDRGPQEPASVRDVQALIRMIETPDEASARPHPARLANVRPACGGEMPPVRERSTGDCRALVQSPARACALRRPQPALADRAGQVPRVDAREGTGHHPDGGWCARRSGNKPIQCRQHQLSTFGCFKNHVNEGAFVYIKTNKGEFLFPPPKRWWSSTKAHRNKAHVRPDAGFPGFRELLFCFLFSAF